jgi:hypothetical protein
MVTLLERTGVQVPTVPEGVEERGEGSETAYPTDGVADSWYMTESSRRYCEEALAAPIVGDLGRRRVSPDPISFPPARNVSNGA